jgi:hypothetical protein
VSALEAGCFTRRTPRSVNVLAEVNIPDCESRIHGPFLLQRVLESGGGHS